MKQTMTYQLMMATIEGCRKTYDEEESMVRGKMMTQGAIAILGREF